MLKQGWLIRSKAKLLVNIAVRSRRHSDNTLRRTGAEQQIDQAILNKVLSIQQLPDEDKEHIMYSIDGLIQHAKTRMAYKK